MTSSMTEPGLQIIWQNPFICSLFVLLCNYKIIDYLKKTHTIPNNPIMEGNLKIKKFKGLLKICFYQVTKTK